MVEQPHLMQDVFRKIAEKIMDQLCCPSEHGTIEKGYLWHGSRPLTGPGNHHVIRPLKSNSELFLALDTYDSPRRSREYNHSILALFGERNEERHNEFRKLYLLLDARFYRNGPDIDVVGTGKEGILIKDFLISPREVSLFDLDSPQLIAVDIISMAKHQLSTWPETIEIKRTEVGKD